MAGRQAQGPFGLRIIQLGFTVRSLEAAIDEWVGTMGAGPFFVADVALPMTFRGMDRPAEWKVAHGCSGDLFIELIEAGPMPSIYTERDFGLHHAMVAGDGSYADLKSHFLGRGCQIAAEHDSELARFCYLDGATNFAPFLELYDMPPDVTDLFRRIRSAHAAWNGSDPVRPLA